MHFTKIIASLSLATGLYAIPTSAYAKGCSLDGVILNCSANGNSAASIATAFASQETQDALSAPLSQVQRFTKNGSVERYRRSVEQNWRTITRLSRQKERQRRQGRLSSSQFNLWQGEFSQAQQSYDVAINFYRQLHWQGLK